MVPEVQTLLNESWGLQGVAYGIVALRFYCRIKTLGWRNLDWDDFLMAIATVVYTAESVAAYFVGAYWKGLANNDMTDSYRAALDPNSEEWRLRVNGSKTHVIGLLLYMTLLWLLKGCWVIFYHRLTNGLQNQKLLVRWAMVIIPVTYVGCLLVALLKCRPFNHQWQINPYPGNNCTPAVSYLQTIFVMIMNTFTDLYLMAIPIPMVWKARLPWRKKLSLTIMFSGGLLEMTFRIIRCVTILTVGGHDPAQSGYWSVRESFVCFALTNMPIVYPLFRGFFEKVSTSVHGTVKSSVSGTSGWASSGRASSGRASSGAERYKMGGHFDRSRAKSKDPMPIPPETPARFGSDEHIVISQDPAGSGRTVSSESASEIENDHLHSRTDFPREMSHTEVIVGSGPTNSRTVHVPPGSRANSGILVTSEYDVSNHWKHDLERNDGAHRNV